ncbi:MULTISPECIES: flagellar hook-associated protein FlgK [unclassified Pseudomonas]|uniref:flagellar hook-associated protein FlgK n=1 Tax=unclassified Pseudomonas TaxID=196821 RepID=UPI002AC9A92C|nr:MULTISPECIES: flagellar hook-associated protein FlgK [unclassified Pseudomonas]MEB0041401.1 flagellar hook-associated protein FlgK [Pseudomonas sp. MH10]MEB0078677.1 flagellar hook-associated protein FlgK [Pseudomonas sp. MH10out]MEB0093265.1 flagellar hook-associated protein FlgK [Pseudomonas sp. CCI4.2]MEB0103741.1 flagellar hook-associated protein FlgK [Pseudomonas sp. CCI3.2]MEB0121184.1 flagellar hook-associated protein FlgK [Pseudomonas sp. CCI1.2]
MSLISIGLSGLTANSAALNTISNNISNVDTAGYSRQQVVTSASAPQNVGYGYIGTGTTLMDVRRIYNSYLDSQLQTSTSLSSDTTAFLGQVSSTDTLLSDSSTGVASVLTTFFTQLQAVSTNPTDAGARSQLLTTAGSLSSRFNSISAQLSSQSTDINSQLTTLASQVNTLSASIANLNKQITQASATGSTPNSMLDSRNEAVRQLNMLVGAKVIDNNGSYDITIGTGQTLVSGTSVNTLSAGPSSSDPSQYNLSVSYGQSSTDVTSVVTGGSIGGLLRYRSDVLAPATNELGRVALTVSDQINSQLNQGVDLNGAFGSNLFSSINTATQVSQRSIASMGNSAGSGNLDVTIADTSKITASDYQVTFTSATAYDVKRLPDGTDMGAYDLATTPTPVIDGFSIAKNGGAFSAGDSFKVTPTRNAAGNITTTMTDPNALAAAAPISASAGASNKGSTTISQQPTITTPIDIYDASSSADLRTGITNSTPIKLVFGAATSGSQSYTMFNAQGTSIGSGTIVPGQSNTLNLKVPMVDASGNAINTTGASPVQKTFTVQMTISGTPTANDSYSLSMTAAGSSDNRNASATSALQSAPTIGVSGTSTGISLSDAYGKLVGTVGAQAAQAKSDNAATTAIVTQAKAARDSVSGVNLDEETANLVKYQQYYTASSQIIKTAQDMFTTLINAL